MTPLRKPVRRVAAVDPDTVPHGVSSTIVATLYPGGVLGLREARHRKEYVVHLGVILERAIVDEVLQRRRERAKARRADRKRRRK